MTIQNILNHKTLSQSLLGGNEKIAIANYLNVSRSLVSKVVREEMNR